VGRDLAEPLLDPETNSNDQHDILIEEENKEGN
jgi:hypothetical protein